MAHYRDYDENDNRYNDRYDDRRNDWHDRYPDEDRYYGRRRDNMDSRAQSLSGYGQYGNYGNERSRHLDRGYGISHARNDWGYNSREWNAPHTNFREYDNYYPYPENRGHSNGRQRNQYDSGMREDYLGRERNRARNDYYNAYGHSYHEGFRNPEADGGYGHSDYNDYYDDYTTMPARYRSPRRAGIEGLNWNEPDSAYPKYGGSGGWL